MRTLYVGTNGVISLVIKQQGESQNVCFKKKTKKKTNKASQKAMFVFRKIWLALFYFETPVLRFVLFCLITDDMLFYSVMFSVSICFFLCFLFVCVCFVKDFFHLFCSLSRQVGGGASK